MADHRQHAFIIVPAMRLFAPIHAVMQRVVGDAPAVSVFGHIIAGRQSTLLTELDLASVAHRGLLFPYPWPFAPVFVHSSLPSLV